MSQSVSALPSRVSCAVFLAASACLAGCASVDLGPRYDPPPVRAPQSPPPVPSDVPLVVTPLPVPPPQPVPQPLPPIGSPAPLPPIGSPAPLPPVGMPAPPPAPVDAQSYLVTLTTRLEGASVMPPTRSGATGQLDALYDSRTRLLRWKVVWSGLGGPITAVNFHGPAEPGQNGPPALVWPAPFGPTYEGRATLTPMQAADLLQGRWYISVYTGAYPAGEVRGQLRVVQ